MSLEDMGRGGASSGTAGGVARKCMQAGGLRGMRKFGDAVTGFCWATEVCSMNLFVRKNH